MVGKELAADVGAGTFGVLSATLCTCVGVGAAGAAKTTTFVIEYHAELPLIPSEGRRLLLP